MEDRKLAGVMICSIIAITHFLVQFYVYLNSSKLAGDMIMKPIYICIAVSYLLSGAFLLRFYNWARILFIFQMVYTFVITGSELLKIPSTNSKAFTIYLIFILFPAIWSIIYLTRPKVKEQFK